MIEGLLGENDDTKMILILTEWRKWNVQFRRIGWKLNLLFALESSWLRGNFTFAEINLNLR